MEIIVRNGVPLPKEALEVIKMAIEKNWDIYLGFDYDSTSDRTIIQIEESEE